MKIILFLSLILAINTQLGDDVTKGVNGDVTTAIEDFKNNVNDDINAKNQAFVLEERKRLMDEFMDATRNKLESVRSVKKEVNVGEFLINVTSSCILELPELPVIENPVDVECIEGHFQGEIMAQSIASLTKENPPSTKDMMLALKECEIVVSNEITFNLNIFNNCLSMEIKEYYNKYFKDLVHKMKKNGFELTTDGEGNHKFVKLVEEIVQPTENTEPVV